jgi:hypothetical protein
MVKLDRAAAEGTPSDRGTEIIPSRSQVVGGPETPLELGKTGWRHVMKRSFKEFAADRCTMTAPPAGWPPLRPDWT